MTWELSLVFAMLAQAWGSDKVFAFLVWVHQQLWITAPLILVTLAHDSVVYPHSRFLLSAIAAFVMWLWWKYRNWPDENKWTRRGRRLKEKVAARGGKLVVEPATA